MAGRRERRRRRELRAQLANLRAPKTFAVPPSFTDPELAELPIFASVAALLGPLPAIAEPVADASEVTESGLTRWQLDLLGRTFPDVPRLTLTQFIAAISGPTRQMESING